VAFFRSLLDGDLACDAVEASKVNARRLDIGCGKNVASESGR
jgi:hypothetical protein